MARKSKRTTGPEEPNKEKTEVRTEERETPKIPGIETAAGATNESGHPEHPSEVNQARDTDELPGAIRRRPDTPWVALDKEFYRLKHYADTPQKIVRSCELIRGMFLVPKRILRAIDELLSGDVTPERVKEIFWYWLPPEQVLRQYGYNLDMLYPEDKPKDDEAVFKAVVDAAAADSVGFDLCVRDKHRQELIEYLCNRGNITAETPNETIAFVHDMEKVLLVKLWEVTIPNEAWEKTLVRAHSLITAYHRFGIRLPMLMEFAACIIAKNFPAIESALPAARMELSLALQELVLRMQAQTATPTIGAQEAPGAAPHEVVTSDTANATPKGENEAASARDSEPVANDDVWITFTEAVEMLVRDTDLSAGQARNRLSRHRDHPPIRDNGKTRKARRFDKNTIYAFIQTQNEDECDAEDQRTQEERGFKGYR